MKKVFGVFIIVLVTGSCTNESTSAEQKLDSLGEKVERKLNTIEDKLDTTLDKVADTVKAKALNLKEKVKEKWKSRKDSSSKRDLKDQ